MTLDKDFIRQLSAKHGFKAAPPDHWIYSEGPTTHFLPPRSLTSEPRGVDAEVVPCDVQPQAQTIATPNTCAEKVYAALHESLHDGSVSADDVADMVTLNVGESVTWAEASTYYAPLLINLFACTAPDQPLSVLAAHHSDGGVLDFADGPWASIAEAKTSYGEVPEGWTDL